MQTFQGYTVNQHKLSGVKHIHLLTSTTLALCLLLGCQSAYDRGKTISAELPEVVDFNFHIKPILSDRCFKCHGPDQRKREANLRLDEPQSALHTPLENGGYAFVPGSTSKSVAFKRMITQDPELTMPPPETSLTLSPAEIALFEKWIVQGAHYKKHWSYIPPEKPNIPDVKYAAWPKNKVDHFVLARLERSGLQPNDPADEEVLLRRLHLDLTGLPPTEEEMDLFLSSTDPDKVTRAIDQLLASPHFGERMALEWMDVARYADSHGYSQDGSRVMYPWRDWVIKAFNENMPFDDFILWQMAGDLLPETNSEKKLATAFLRNHRINAEGGIIPEEYRVEYVADRSQTMATAFLGLTLECARCHDHKYDPISQRDYFQLFSFFNQTNEEGQGTPDGNTGPEVYLSDDENLQKVKILDKKIRAQEIALEKMELAVERPPSISIDDIRADVEQDLVAWVNYREAPMSKKGKSHFKDQVHNRSYPSRGDPPIVASARGSVLEAGAYNGMTIPSTLIDFPRAQPFSFCFWLDAHPETDFMEIIHRMGSKYRGQKGYDIALRDGHLHIRIAHSLPANLIEVRMLSPLQIDEWSHIAVTYDGSGRAAGIKWYLDGKIVQGEILYDQLERTIMHAADLTVGGSIHLDENVDDGHFHIDDLRIYQKSLTEAEVAVIYNPISALSDTQISRHHLLRQNRSYLAAADHLQHHRRKRNELENEFLGVMVMQDVPRPRPTFVLDRGQYDAPTTPVSMGVPEAIKAFPAGAPQNRLGLAQWLTADDHPLTARVTVNRVWQQFFGRGIVNTVEDLGSQGALPTHPDLLDWLSVTFMESGWDLKALLRTIAISATYQQSSMVPLEARRDDPHNALLARGPSNRLSAELLRDNMLVAAGLWNDSIGGPSVKPYQPPGLWDEKSSFSKDLARYQPDHGSDLYRRSLYTFWRRTSHHPVMSIFDAPSRDNCTVRRQMSNTPLQALAMMNETQFVEASRVLAALVMERASTDDAQIVLAHRLLSGCRPAAEVVRLLVDLLTEERKRFGSDPRSAEQLLSIGEYPRDPQKNQANLAAMTVVCNTMMNFDEVVTKR